MNKLFSSPKQLLKFMLLFSATILALGVIFVCVFGFNKSYQFGGQYEVSIDYIDADKTDSYIKNITEIIEKNNGKVTHSNSGEKEYLYTLSVQFESNSTDISQVKETLVEIFDGEVIADHITIGKLSNTFATKNLVWLILPFSIVLVALFVYGWLRRNYIYGFANMITFAGTILIGLALFAVTRTQISIATLGILSAIAILSVAVFVYYTSISYMNKNSVHGEKEKLVDLYVKSINSSIWVMLIPTMLLVLTSVAFMLTFNASLVQFGLAGIISTFAGLWSSIFLSGAFYFSIKEDDNEHKKVKIK